VLSQFIKIISTVQYSSVVLVLRCSALYNVGRGISDFRIFITMTCALLNMTNYERVRTPRKRYVIVESHA